MKEKHYYLFEEAITGETYIVWAYNKTQAWKIAEEAGADYSCGCEKEPDVYFLREVSQIYAERSGLEIF